MKQHLKRLLRHDVHPAIQFIKYGVAGGVATGVDMLVFFLLAWKVFPALTEGERLVTFFQLSITVVEESVRSRNFILNSVMTFLCSNFVAYLLNIFWVFKPGRHQRHVEVILFYVVSIVSFLLGTFVGWALINFWGLTTTVSYLAKMIASVMINYVCRKYIVFKG